MKPENSRRFREAASLSTNRSLSLTAFDRLRHGPTRTSSGETAAAQFPIRFADIIFAEVLGPNGRNPKTRRVVVLTPDIELAAGFPIVVAGVTGTLPNPLTADYVKLPYKNPPQEMVPDTFLTLSHLFGSSLRVIRRGT